MASSDFDRLFTRQVPTIHMKIFFSLDWNSFKGCLEVCRIWKDLLMSESFHEVGASVYRKEIHDELWQAVINGQTNEVRHILSSGIVDMNFKNKEGYTTLMCAAKFGRIGVVKLLLDRGANPNELTITTPLHVAAEYCHPDVVKVLLVGGAEPNKGNIDGDSALMSAASQCHEDVVKLLLDRGADANMINKSGMTALHVVIAGGKPRCDYAYSSWPKITKVIQLLLSQGADPNMADQAGETPLHYAAEKGQPGVVQCLLDRGADPYQENHEGMTALDVVSRDFYTDVADIL